MAAVSGGFAMGGGDLRAGAITYAVQMYALKGEDKFVAVPDVLNETTGGGGAGGKRRNLNVKRGSGSRADATTSTTAAAADDDDDFLSFDDPRSGDFLAVFGVFDGHVNNSASSHCERQMLPELLRCGADADASSAPLETALVTAFERVERSYSLGSDCCFPGGLGGCLPASRGGGGGGGARREGGTTACVVCVQRRKRGGANAEARVDLVCANAGDSGALFVSFATPSLRATGREPRLSADVRRSIDEDAATAPDMPEFRRLTRDHNPDDPFEARRLVDAGARLARMRQGGQEVGPMRSYPGGLAVSRAIGDLNARAVICKPECTRMPVPASGGRVVLASDGLWNALGDGEVATIAHEAESSRSAAHALLRAVFQRRGAHDDITLVVVDVPPPPLVQKWAAGRSDVAAGADKLAAVNGDEKVSPLGNARARKSVDQLVRDARLLSNSLKQQPPPEWAETRDAQGKANRGRKFNVEADVTVRRGLDPAFANARLGTGETNVSSASSTRKPKRPVNRGCLACLLGGGVDHSALADVDDADAEDGAALRDDYVLGAVLGRGMYGSVRLAYLKPGRRGSMDNTKDSKDSDSPDLQPTTTVARAVKSIATDGSKRSAERVRNEVDAMYAVSGRHPNLPTVFASYEQKTVGPVGGTFLQVIHIVTEAYTGHDLVAAIARRGSLRARDWEAVAAQLLGATAFLHAVGVVHRDIKPENVMLKRGWVKDQPPACVLVDFGGAAFARGKTRVLTGFVGTKFFGAPECFAPGSRHGAKSDVWSIGVTLLTVLAGTPAAYELGNAWRTLQGGTIPAVLKPPSATPRRFKRLMHALLTVDQTNRPSAAQALSSNPWLMGHVTSLSSTHKGSPDKAVPVFGDDEHENSPGGGSSSSPLKPCASLRLHGEEELANAASDVLRKNTTNAARSEFSRVAAFILSVCLDSVAIDALVAELRPTGCSARDRKSFDALGGAEGVASAHESSPFSDDDVVPAGTLEKALWTVGAREAAMQLGLLRAQTVNAAANDLARLREEEKEEGSVESRGAKPALDDANHAKEVSGKTTPAAVAARLADDKKTIANALSVEFRRLTTLVDLHERHQRVYEAVVEAKSDKSRTGRFTMATSKKTHSTLKPSFSNLNQTDDDNQSAHRLNQGDSLHGGMLMAMLARQAGDSRDGSSRRGRGFPAPTTREEDLSREGSGGGSAGTSGEGSSHAGGISSRDVELAPWSKSLIPRSTSDKDFESTDYQTKSAPDKWWQEETALAAQIGPPPE